MNDKLLVRCKSASTKKHKNPKFRKPFWNDELERLYKNIAKVEGELRVCMYRQKNRISGIN